MSARRKAITGFVKVRYLITEDGMVERVKVMESHQKAFLNKASSLHSISGHMSPPVIRVSLYELVTKTFRFN